MLIGFFALFSLLVPVLSGRHPGHDPFEGFDLEALAGDVLLVKDPDHFAVGSGLLYVVATAVVGDFEDFEGEVLPPDTGAPKRTT